MYYLNVIFWLNFSIKVKSKVFNCAEEYFLPFSGSIVVRAHLYENERKKHATFWFLEKIFTEFIPLSICTNFQLMRIYQILIYVFLACYDRIIYICYLISSIEYVLRACLILTDHHLRVIRTDISIFLNWRIIISFTFCSDLLCSSTRVCCSFKYVQFEMTLTHPPLLFNAP